MLSHLDKNGRARMVDVTVKPPTSRTASASGRIRLRPETLNRILEGGFAKGDVLAVARVAGLMAVKRVPDLIPLCHPIPISGAVIRFKEEAAPDGEGLCRIGITATVRTVSTTGVEMEALMAVTVAALTLYDMCKSVDRDISIGEVMLQSKSGGRSGEYRREKKISGRSKKRQTPKSRRRRW